MQRIIPFLLVGVFLCLPLFVSAQSGPLVPCDGPECQACHVVQLGQNIINFLVGVASFLAVLMFAYGGFLMLTAAGNTSQIAKGKGVFTNVLVGLLIVLMGWLIVDTVMKYTFQGTGSIQGSPLYQSTESTFGPWNQINCVAQPIPIIREGDAPGATALNLPPDVASQGGWIASDAENRERLKEAGIEFYSSGGCTDPNIKSCTSVAGMQQSTIDQIIAIQEACPNCGITVTGGTETGHARGNLSHSEGYKIDIDDGNATLNNFLTSTDSGMRYVGEREGQHGGEIYKDRCGNEYVKESDHWDITVTQVCSF